MLTLLTNELSTQCWWNNSYPIRFNNSDSKQFNCLNPTPQTFTKTFD